MKNPFFSFLEDSKKEYLSSVCSLNKAVVAQLPIRGIDDSIQGKTFKDIFSTKLVVDEIKKLSRAYGVDISAYDESALPKMLDDALVSDDIKLRQMASRVALKFGNRLGMLLLTLRLGQEENRLARPQWNDSHWQYYKELKKIIFVGGLASGMLGRKFKERIQYVFDVSGAKPYDIMIFDNATYIGAMGCAQHLMNDDTSSLVLDFGHTNIKRCVIKKSKGQISEFIPLDSKRSRYMHSVYEQGEDVWNTALELHKYLVKIIVDSYKTMADVYRLSDEILISIANYVQGEKLNCERGGYAKLCELGSNYTKILTEDVSSQLKKNVSIRLVHDGTATALYFSEVDSAVCLSLGTGFGVGFPDINI